MKTVPLGSGLPRPVAPVLDDGSPEALSARCDYEIITFFCNCRDAGYELKSSETSDFDALVSKLDTFKTGFLSWLTAAPEPPDDDDPTVRGLPAVIKQNWLSVASEIALLSAAGVGGLVPAFLADLAFEILQEVFAEWLAGKIFPGESGSMDELVNLGRKAFMIDPGLADRERSVFVGEKNGTGFAGLFQGDFASIGQLLYEALHVEKDGSKVSVLAELLEKFTIIDKDGVERSVLEMGLLDMNAEGQLFSLLWALARQQIRIVVSSNGDLDDVLIEPST